MGNTIGIIQARMGSTRLPGKILAPIGGRPLLEMLALRLRGSGVRDWWLATTEQRDDDITAAWGRALGLRVFRGAVDDVLSRFAEVSRRTKAEWVVRITADDPFVDDEIVDLLLAARREYPRAPLIEIDGRSGMPLGYAPQLARADAILRAEREIPSDAPHHRTHVLSWLAERGESSLVKTPGHWPRRPGWRWTVDTPDDLAMARRAFERFGVRARSIGYPAMVATLDPEPDITALNDWVPQRAVAAG